MGRKRARFASQVENDHGLHLGFLLGCFRMESSGLDYDFKDIGYAVVIGEAISKG